MTKIVELIINEENQKNKDGVFAISLVEEPAIQSDFIALSKQKKLEVQFSTLNKEKQLLVGAVLIPNKQILRIDDETGEDYYVYFSKQTIKKASELFMMNNFQNSHTLEHKKDIDHLTVVESWIKDTELDKSHKYGFSKLPLGTWFVSVKVNDKAIWDNYVKTGKVKGFSIEGYFTDKTELSKAKKTALGKVGTMITDGIELPLYDTPEEAEKEAENLGGSGYHEHTMDGNVYYMPFNDHDEAKEVIKDQKTLEEIKNIIKN